MNPPIKAKITAGLKAKGAPTQNQIGVTNKLSSV